MRKKPTLDPGAEQDAVADAQAFRAAVRDVTPLKASPRVLGAALKPRVRVRKPPATPAENLDELMPLITAPLNEEHSGQALSFQRSGVRTQVMRRLRRGLYPADGELDLHGLNQSAARDRLADYLRRSRDAGWRCVRIIHGKGYRSGARGPVLKTAVDLWLRRHMDVMAFTSARAIDGGTGAVYVLLRA
jgi:DNA-nicking Smr family endonuclease